MKTKVLKGCTFLLLIVCLLSFPQMITSADSSYSMISPGMSESGATEIPVDGKDYVATITEEMQTQYFTFSVPSDATGFYTFYVKNLSMTDSFIATLSSSVGEKIAGSDYLHQNHDFCQNQKLTAGTTYIIQIKGYYGNYGTGNYKLNLSYRDDEEADTMAGAKTIAINKTYVKTSDGYWDNDYFKFTPSTTGYYELFSKNLSMTDCYSFKIYSSAEEELYNSNDYLHDYLRVNRSCDDSLKLVKGDTYYIKVEGRTGTGKYKFSINQINPPAVSALKVTRTESTSFTASWKKVSNITGYEIQYSTNKKFKDYSTATNDQDQNKIYFYDMLSKTTYYVRVRAYKDLGGSRFYGKYSAVKKIRTK